MEQVVVAVQSLHGPMEPQARQEALRWLERFQNTIDAWDVSVSLLNAADASGPVRFFAAQTLKHKIVADFVQLDERMTSYLKETLLSLLLSETGAGAGTGDGGGGGEGRQVTQQLILAVAALAVQCAPSIWPAPLEDLLQNIRPDAGQTPKVLGVLACIPEQMENSLISMSGTQQTLQRKRLVDDNVDRVISLMGTLLSTGRREGDHRDGGQLRAQLLACLLSWIKYGAAANPQLVGSPDLLQSMLLCLLQDIRQEGGDAAAGNTLESSAEIVCEIFFRHFQLEEPPSEAYLSVLFGGLVAILPHLRELLTSAEGDEDQILRVGRVFLEAGEAFLPFIIGNAKAIQVILDAALLLAKYEGDDSHGGDLRVVEATFSFWSSLEMRLAEADEATKTPFLPVYADLFRSLTSRHLAFPLHDDRMSAEERDAFRDFRHVIGDCLKDCTRVMGSTVALLIVAELLRAQGASAPWQRVEASLFALRTISSSVDRRESEALPEIFHSLLQIRPPAAANNGVSSPGPSPHPKLVYAVILNIGCYAEWTRYHGEFVAPFLSYLVAGFPEHPAASSMALKYLCQSCDTLLISHEPDLRSLYTQRLDAAGKVGDRDTLELSEAVANVLAAMGEAQMSPLLPHYLTPWLAQLGGAQPAATAALDNLTVFIELVGGEEGGEGGSGRDRSSRSPSSLDRFSPTMDAFLTQLIPNLSLLLAHPALLQGDERMAESLTLLLKTIIVHHGRFSAQLVDLLDAMYASRGLPGSLYALRYVVIREPKVISWLRLRRSLQSAVQATSMPGGGSVDFFHFATAVLDYYEEMLAEQQDPENQQMLLAMLEVTRRTLSASPLNPTDVSSALLFLLHLFARLASSAALVHRADLCARLSAPLSACLQAALQGAISSYPHTLLADVAALLRRYHGHSYGEWRALVGALLAALPETLFVAREKQAWMERLEAATVATRPRELKETLIALVNACRRRL